MLLSLRDHEGETHPKKNTHPNKSTVCANNFGTVCTNCPHHLSGKKKTNKHKHFGRDGVRDKQEPSLGTDGTPPQDKLGPVPGTNRPFSV